VPNIEETMEARLRYQRTALADFGLFAVRCDDLDKLLHRACELISSAMGVDLVKVLEHKPDRREMLMRSGVNWKPGVVGNMTMPDHEGSPGGYALQSEEAVISDDVDEESRFEIPSVLRDHGVRSMVNVIIVGDHRPFGVLEVDARERREFGEDDIAFLRLYANLLAAAIERIHAHQKLQDIADEQQMLAQEFAHRAKNILTVVRSLASLTSTEDRSASEYREAFIGRLEALAAAEKLAFSRGDGSIDIREIAFAVLEPYRSRRRERFRLEGPTVALTDRDGRMLGLAFHELATNAIKHGSLSLPEGVVEIAWSVEENDGQNRLRLNWRERHGPQMRFSERTGFGTRLLEKILPFELDGLSELKYGEDGLSYTLEFATDRSP
jgi:two-component sensor histidine kinase